MPASREDVVDLLTRMGTAMRGRGDDMRARAYLRAANSVARRDDFDALLKQGRLREIDGVGPKIDEKIRAFSERGETPSWLDAPGGIKQVRADAGSAAPLLSIPRSWKDAPFADVPDLHVHTTWSDGTLTLDEVVALAQRLGATAIGISDHSGSLRIARGLRPAEVLQQWADIERVQAAYPDVRILRGTECDIKRDGSLDHPEHILSGFDYVIGSLHSQLKLPKKEQTERVLAALDSPYLSALGHPTTAVPGYRPPANIDFDRVFEKAAKNGVAMEVNGNPGRLDLPVKLAKRALEAGCMLSLGSDGHSAREMLSLAKARGMAKAAGATRADLLNAKLVSTPDRRARGTRGTARSSPRR